MNWRAIRAIVRKDLKVVLQSKAVTLPIIIVPLLILVILPGVAGVVLANLDADSAVFQDFQDEMGLFLDNMPANVEAQIEGYENEVQQLAYLAFNLFFAPLYLILPTMVANVIAADSFVGEKERSTLEALVYTPTSDRELYLAKILAPWLAAIVVGFIGFLAYGIVVNVTAWPLMGAVFFPNLAWILLVVWVTPGAAGLGLGAMVLVSSRVNTFQEAYQLGGMVVLPIVLLLFGQITGVLYFDVLVVFLIGLVLWLVTLGLIAYGANSFRRGTLLAGSSNS